MYICKKNITMANLFKITERFVLQLIVIAFVFTGRGVNAQSPYPYDFSFAGIPINAKTIVRSYDDQHAVVYYEESGLGYVSLVDVIANSAITVPLESGTFINDMCIMNDSVFLCGKFYYMLNSIYYTGCIVTMNLNSFYSGSVLVTRIEPSYWIRMEYKRIKSFEYTYGLDNDIYAKFLLVSEIKFPCDNSEPFPLNYFTKTYGGGNNPSWCYANAVAEVSYPFTNGFPSVLYQKQRVLRPMNPNEHTEFIHDVVVTDNYVAFVGVEPGSSNAITLHICNKGANILKSDYSSMPYQICDFDKYYTYSLGTSNGNPFYHACALEGDRIAIATQDEVSSSSNSITVRTFDLTTHTMTNAQELHCNSHPDLKDIAYIPNLHRIVLLYNDFFRQINNNCDIFCTLDPYNINSTYVTQGITDNVFHNKFSSLDAMMFNSFISTGGQYGFMADASSFGINARCYLIEDFNVFNHSTIIAAEETYDYDIHKLHSYMDLKDTVWQPIVLPSQCIEN